MNINLFEQKLKKIGKFWDYYPYTFQFPRSKIKWDEESKSIFHDIIDYYLDTLKILTDKKEDDENFHGKISYWTSLLQTIYVHQDLMDELLKIFKLKQSTGTNKKKNRILRNNLIGHPINYCKEKKLRSSIFWGGELTFDTLNYIKYERVLKNGEFKGIDEYAEYKDIIKRHSTFLNSHADQIINEINQILTSHSQILAQLETALEDRNDVEKILELCSNLFEQIFNDHFKFETLKKCKSCNTEHPRYKFLLDDFYSDLEKQIADYKKNITEFTKKEETIKKEELEFNIQFEGPSVIESIEIPTSQKKDYRNDFNKLKGDKTLIKYFENEFKVHDSIMDELKFLKTKDENSIDYVISHQYLRHLILIENL